MSPRTVLAEAPTAALRKVTCDSLLLRQKSLPWGLPSVMRHIVPRPLLRNTSSLFLGVADADSPLTSPGSIGVFLLLSPVC